MPTNEIKSEQKKSELTPTSDGGDLGQQREDQRNEPVLDFLYHDARRVASLLSQFETYGTPQQVKAIESVRTSQTTKTNFGADIGMPLVAKGTIGRDTQTTDETFDSAERTYDPFWSNALTLIRFLEAREILRRDVTTARIGQFVQVSGKLLMIDLSIMKQLWPKTAIRKALSAGATQTSAQNRHERRAQNAQKSDKQDNTEAILSIVEAFPHTIQGNISFGGGGVWFNLKPECMVTEPADLLLKHGIEISGEWSAVGILDALPNDESDGDPLLQMLNRFGDVGGTLGGHLRQMLELARQTMGRSKTAYGLTPLVIFRKVST